MTAYIESKTSAYILRFKETAPLLPLSRGLSAPDHRRVRQTTQYPSVRHSGTSGGQQVMSVLLVNTGILKPSDSLFSWLQELLAINYLHSPSFVSWCIIL